jgi:transcriptional antiterminator
MSATKYVTTAELAAHFNVSNATIMAMMKSGEIPSGTFMRLGRVFRYDLKKIEQALLTRGGPVDDVEDSPQEPALVQYEFDFGTDDTTEENPYA